MNYDPKKIEAKWPQEKLSAVRKEGADFSRGKQKKVATYDPKKIEKKWQSFWLQKKTFFADQKKKGKKKMVLIEFPYPSGAGLHMGHMRPFVAGDVVSKYMKLQGFNVMYPIGWDAFGLPAENYAIKNKVHPKVSTAKNVANAKKQLQSWGTGFDWAREINTTDPEYYKWTQKLFLEFFKAGLAYEKFGEINWCPKDKTGLANEEVIDGKCERCGTNVEKKNLRQWYLKITNYAEKLLAGLKELPEWPNSVKVQQENWIGRSEGSEITFAFTRNNAELTQKDAESKAVTVFTTRADTLFGVTYLVLAPENNLVQDLKQDIKNWSEVERYITECKNKTDIERTGETKEKTGVELQGIFAINPVNNEKVPVWIADYVLVSYGTGAVMAVPAHDERDFMFANKYHSLLKPVILPTNEWIDESVDFGTGHTGDSSIESRLNAYLTVEPMLVWGITKSAYQNQGVLVNSGKFNGLTSEEAKKQITEFVGGKIVTKYKLRDWVFSRQRYWGEPIPLIHCEKCGIVAVPDKDLPIKLPEVKNYEPTGTGESPLASIDKWVNVKCPKCKGKAKRETNTMPQWAGSSWYWLRYMDPKNKKTFADKSLQKYWSPVDLYFGGMEHTTLHLLYSRFWNLFFYDRGLVTVKEPYKKRVPHGIILGPDGEKMSKSRGNVVNPDDVIKLYGADTTRLYMMFLGPHGAQVSWNDKGIIGTRRFLERVWAMQDFVGKKESPDVTVALQKAIKKTTEDLETFSFNTIVSSLMIFANTVYESKSITKKSYETFLLLLAPFAPHMVEEIWKNLGNKKSIYESKWPKWKEDLIKQELVTVVVQINGKVKAELKVEQDIPDDLLQKIALKDPKIEEILGNIEPKRVIVVKNRLVNIVI